VLSRRAYAESDKYGIKGFYFVKYDTLEKKTTNERYNRLFYPLVQLELLLGTGRGPATDPIWAGDQAPWE
jgi:hypothetical protein